MQSTSHQFPRCEVCGAQNLETAKFCVQCGQELTSPSLTDGVSEPIALADLPLSRFALPAINADAILGVMPTLRSLAKAKQQELGNILDGYHFIFILHFLSDLLGFMEAFRMLGLPWERAHFLYKDYRYP